ncbi:MAG TPA: pantetheine-phosphate adenylyltransferase [Chloroflexia bacterium]|nr:pantetheine-phosphate adenylyltransferase [Chloroflexia bacterium]
MRIAIYPGTFDPITNGHLDIARRAAHLFDKVIVAVAVNSQKRPIFTVEERKALIREAVLGVDHAVIAVDSFTGLTTEYARRVGAVAIVRGLRVLTDFEWELQLALINDKLAPDIETVCLMTAQEHSFLSASVVRELAHHGNTSLRDLVPPHVAAALARVYGPGGPPGVGASDRSDV